MKMYKRLSSLLIPSTVFIAVIFVLVRNTSAILPKDFFQTISSTRNVRAPPMYHNNFPKKIFHDNESLIGKSIPCSYEEDVCFRYNTLYSPKKRRCLLSMKEWCHLVPLELRESIMNGTSHLFAMCPDDNDHCSGPRVLATQICDKALARNITCNCGVEPDLRLFGGVECRCWKKFFKIESFSNFTKKGRCLIPSLISPENHRSGLSRILSSSDLLVPELLLECSEEQRKCFSLGKVWMPGKTGCFRLLERGPCPKGQIVALNASQARQRNVEVICVEKRGGCPAKQIRMLFDGQCHKKRDMKLLSASPIFITLYGQYHVFFSDVCLKKGVLALHSSNNSSDQTCVVHHSTYSEINARRCHDTKHGLQNSSISAVIESKCTERLTQTNTTSVPQQSTATPPVGVRGFRRFHANDSFIGRPVPCTFEEKICFGYNTLYYPMTGRCLDKAMEGDKHDFLNGSGRLFAKEQRDPCPGYRMAYDGRCYPKNIVHDVICGCDAAPILHFLGGWECLCPPSTPIHVEQPKEEGRCRIPDLRFPDYFRSQLRNESWRDNLNGDKCSDEQRRCFLENKVWMEDKRVCFTLNEKGPCAENHVVVLTKEKFTNGSAVCRHSRNGCEPGFLRLARDGKCHDERKVKVSLPGSNKIYRNMFGEYYIEDEIYNNPRPSAGFSPEICLFNVNYVKSDIPDNCELYNCKPQIDLNFQHYLEMSPCRAHGSNSCKLYEIETEPPNPEI